MAFFPVFAGHLVVPNSLSEGSVEVNRPVSNDVDQSGCVGIFPDRQLQQGCVVVELRSERTKRSISVKKSLFNFHADIINLARHHRHGQQMWPDKII